MYSAEDIFQLLKDRMEEGLFESFPMLSPTTLGNPTPLYDSNGRHCYWLIPFLLKNKVRGSAIIDLSGKLQSHGVLSPNLTDETRLMEQSFFESVPEKTLEEIRQRYKGYELSTPIFSYDVNPRKWGWYLVLERENAKPIQVFIGPQGFYEKKDLPDRE